jgi:hypothetical protein
MRARALTPALCLTVSLLCFPAIAAAQDVTFGVKAGVNFANVDVDGLDLGEIITFDQRLGVLAGVFIAHDFNPRIGLQFEGLYVQKGTRVKDFLGSGLEYNVRVDSIEIPVLARFSMGRVTDDFRGQILAGPSFGFRVDDTQKLGDETLTGDDALLLKKYDAGLAVGGALMFKKMVVDVRYTFGLVNVDDDPEDADEGITIKNRALAVSIGFIFK